VLLQILFFLFGCLTGPIIILLIGRVMAVKSTAPKKPDAPSRAELIKCVEHLRDRLRVLGGASNQKVIVRLARQCEQHANDVLNNNISK